MDKWLTPSAATGLLTCRRVVFPSGVDWLAIVSGALLQLCQSYNFEQFGTSTPEETAEKFRTMFDDFSLPGERTCRVIGEVIAFAGNVPPDPNWLLCDGSGLSSLVYPDLFAVIGYTYGGALTFFSLPNLQGTVVVGVGTGPGGHNWSIGDEFGEENHTLNNAESANHTHTDAGHTHAEGNSSPTAITIGAGIPTPSAIPTVGLTGSSSANIVASGGGGSHNNIQPSLALNFFIVAG